jgi:hypothetical protein
VVFDTAKRRQCAAGVHLRRRPSRWLRTARIGRALSATDPDGNPLTYAIAGGDDRALFTVDASTGALRFLAAPDFEAPRDADATTTMR